MGILKQYKTFDTQTGEIKIDCFVCIGYNGKYLVYNNENVVLSTDILKEAIEYYSKLLEMDKYISSKVVSYEVYEVVK